MTIKRHTIVATTPLFLLRCGPELSARPPCPEIVYQTEIPVPATATTMVIDTHANAQVTDDARGVRVDIQDNRGTISFGGSGSVTAVIYKRVPWPQSDITLLSGIGVTEGAWLLFWLYCGADGTLTRLYGERTDSTMVCDEAVSGHCDHAEMYWNMPVELPAHFLRNVQMTCGFTVNTPDWDTPLRLGGSRSGTATLEGLTATALVFGTADCRTGCGRPFFELHSVLWEPTRQQVAFAIWYLEGTSSGSGVYAANGLLLPAAGWADMPFPNATWTLER